MRRYQDVIVSIAFVLAFTVCYISLDLESLSVVSVFRTRVGYLGFARVVAIQQSSLPHTAALFPHLTLSGSIQILRATFERGMSIAALTTTMESLISIVRLSLAGVVYPTRPTLTLEAMQATSICEQSIQKHSAKEAF